MDYLAAAYYVAVPQTTLLRVCTRSVYVYVQDGARINFNLMKSLLNQSTSLS